MRVHACTSPYNCIKGRKLTLKRNRRQVPAGVWLMEIDCRYPYLTIPVYTGTVYTGTPYLTNSRTYDRYKDCQTTTVHHTYDHYIMLALDIQMNTYIQTNWISERMKGEVVSFMWFHKD